MRAICRKVAPKWKETCLIHNIKVRIKQECPMCKKEGRIKEVVK